MTDTLTNRTEASHLIEFSATTTSASGYTLELDPDLNGDATTFPITLPEDAAAGRINWVYLRGFPCASNHNLGANLGITPILIRTLHCVKVEMEETLTFCGSSTATTTYNIDSLVGTKYGNEWRYTNSLGEIVRGTYWDGEGHPWTWNGNTITLLDGAQFGVLHIRYYTLCDKFKHYSTVEGIAQCHNTTEWGTDCCSITYVAGENKTVTLVVKDYCTDEVVPNAIVTLRGNFLSGGTWSYTSKTFTTNADGEITFETYSGAKYDMKITCSGYEDSDTDALKNDSITIP